MSYIAADLGTLDLWIEYGFLELLAYLGKYADFNRLHGE